jgi:hypothetical protein
MKRLTLEWVLVECLFYLFVVVGWMLIFFTIKLPSKASDAWWRFKERFNER